MAIYKSALDLVGNTPLLEVTHFEKDNNLEATVLVKLEYFNPCLLYTSPSPRDRSLSRMPSSA